MDLSYDSIIDLRKAVGLVDFLLALPYVDLRDVADDCVICREPFYRGSWCWYGAGETINRPVKLECGYFIGIQCLAKFVFKNGFATQCPMW